MDSDQVKTTAILELEGKLVHAVTDQTMDEVEGLMQAERLIPLNLDGEDIMVQVGSIEYLRKGDHRPQKGEAAPPA